MNLGALPKLSFLTRKAQARDSFVGSSLTSSEELSDRLLTWSGSNDRERLHIMRFRDEWQHPDCPAMKWYIPQKSSSTRFQVVEHHQNVQGPFFHEFLLRLTDGAICRVERTGNGSRADALRRVGCTANDLIQWFTPDCYALFTEKEPSKLIATIDLGQKFDILDVLAICYSIQNTSGCRAYTLQRYNCYFFCLTILSVLTRRVAGWENVIADETWDQSMNASLDSLLDLTPEQAKEHSLLRVCAVLDPSSSKPAEFIIEELREHLALQTGGLTHVNESLGSTLWHAGWESALGAGLRKSVAGVSSSIVYQHENACALALRSALDDSEDMMRQKVPCYDTLQIDCGKMFLGGLSLEMVRLAKLLSQEQVMIEIEHPPRIGARTFCSLAGFLLGLYAAVNPAVMVNDDDDDSILSSNIIRHNDIDTRVAMMKITMTIGPLVIMDVLTTEEIYSDMIDRQREIFAGELGISILSTAMDKMEAKGTLGSLEAMGLVHILPHNIYWKEALASLVTTTFGRLLTGMLQTYDLPAIRVSYVTSVSESDLVSVRNFQDDYIIKRLQAHASRVATHQLAAADLVVRDMQHTMSEVWKKMPVGLGARLAERMM